MLSESPSEVVQLDRCPECVFAPPPRSRVAPVDLVSKDELKSVVQAALWNCQEIGKAILRYEPMALPKDAGTEVDATFQRLCFDPVLVESKIGSARIARDIDDETFKPEPATFEKTAIDVELLAVVAAFLKPLRVNRQEPVVEAICEVAPRGHVFREAHARSLYRGALFSPMFSDWRTHKSRREAAAPTAYNTAEHAYMEKLSAFIQPPMATDRSEVPDTFVARRKAIGGPPADF